MILLQAFISQPLTTLLYALPCLLAWGLALHIMLMLYLERNNEPSVHHASQRAMPVIVMIFLLLVGAVLMPDGHWVELRRADSRQIAATLYDEAMVQIKASPADAYRIANDSLPESAHFFYESLPSQKMPLEQARPYMACLERLKPQFLEAQVEVNYWQVSVFLFHLQKHCLSERLTPA